MEEGKELKERAIEIFEDASFTLHKWQSSEPKLEGTPSSQWIKRELLQSNNWENHVQEDQVYLGGVEQGTR